MNCPEPPRDLPRIAMSVRNMAQEMKLDQLLPFPARVSVADEQTVFEEMGNQSASATVGRSEQMRLLAERVARSFLCLLAPLIALASVGMTNRGTTYLALPLACMSLMSLNLASEWLIRAISPLQPLSAIGVPLAATAIFGILLLALVAKNQSELVRPQLARP